MVGPPRVHPIAHTEVLSGRYLGPDYLFFLVLEGCGEVVWG